MPKKRIPVRLRRAARSTRGASSIPTSPRTRTGPGTRRRRVRWADEVDRFLRSKASDSPVGAAWSRRMRWELRRFPRLVSLPGVLPPPRSVREVREEHLHHLRRSRNWQKPTFAIHFAALRPFLRWARHPLAERRGIWRLPSGQSSRRRWLTREQLARLYSAARGRERLLVGLEGLNGLRRVEVLRLRAGDVASSEGSVRILGKGRDGGKWRTIPVHPLIQPPLQLAVRGQPPEQRLFPIGASAADEILRKAAERAGFRREGLRVSHHDLRRTFGRLAYHGGLSLVQLQHLYGHTSVEMTAHYIGADAEEMRQGLTKLVLFPRAPRTDRNGDPVGANGTAGRSRESSPGRPPHARGRSLFGQPAFPEP